VRGLPGTADAPSRPWRNVECISAITGHWAGDSITSLVWVSSVGGTEIPERPSPLWVGGELDACSYPAGRSAHRMLRGRASVRPSICLALVRTARASTMGETLHSILTRLVAYVAVAIAVGLLFLAGATVYEVMWPRPVVPFSQMSR